jgi:EcsC protein family
MLTASVTMMPPRLSRQDSADLAQAVRLLEGEGFASRLTRLLGGQVRAIGRALPSPARNAIAFATESALKAALQVALRSLNATTQGKANNRWHMAAASAAGAVGGAFGMAATAVELPVSTTILLRSIADIAREQGEDLKAPEAALACLEVFALGGERPTEIGRESGYFAVRAGLAQSVSESARFLLKHGVASETAPVLVRLVSQIAARFGVVVTEKLAAQAVPVVGAVGGAAVNAAFAHHFQGMARGHFTVRRLERKHGLDIVRFEYERLRGEMKQPAAS